MLSEVIPSGISLCRNLEKASCQSHHSTPAKVEDIGSLGLNARQEIGMACLTCVNK